MNYFKKCKDNWSLIFEYYDKSHVNWLNRFLHTLGVPMMALGVTGIVQTLSSSQSVTYFIATAVAFYYLRLGSLKILLIWIFQFLIYQTAVEFLSPLYTTPWVLVLIAGEALLFTGHIIEGNKPTFIQEIRVFLVGPIWVFRKWL